ncbi:adhesion G-protein coupled receptor D2 isoform X2 [Solea solea]|uniref:adhesion G-protein coupled receptor D2 isoform X2 n=1 Tax=Solea solea TaxID=90069 RepID=UPI00272BFA62|nr:adhesion G-protein coupled receptor D2 isoform X2 [Solea solea]
MSSVVFIVIFVSFHCCLSGFTLEARMLTYDESYYEYVPDRLQWSSAGELCNQRFGALATVANSAENQNLNRFLKSIKISQPVWIAKKVMTYLTSSSSTLILEFRGRSDRKHASLKHKFSPMGSVTVCTRLRFDPNCFGISTIFSYSIQSYINEFQLRANLIQGKPVQLALLVHGIHGPYQEAFDHDDFWHSVCVSWSQNGGHWAIYADGLEFSRGDSLNSSDSIGPDGVFIIGQEQDTFGGSFKKDESFSGNITELHIWDRVLNSNEISTMENECTLISSGLVFQWSKEAMKIESSVVELWSDIPCQGNFTDLANPLPTSLMDGNSDGNYSQNQTFSFEVFHNVQSEENCGIFDPIIENLSLTNCDSYRGSVCQFKKDVVDVFSLPNTPFFNRLSKDPANKALMEKLSINTSWEKDLTLLNQMAQAVLGTVEAGGQDSLTSADVLYLSERIDMAAVASTRSARPDAVEVVVSIATNFVRAASLTLAPSMATKRMTRTGDGVKKDIVEAFKIVKEIDSLFEMVADFLTFFRLTRGIVVSTENIVILMKWLRLSKENCSQVFSPSEAIFHTTNISVHDGIKFSDTELQRIRSLGYEEVVFIHTHYSDLNLSYLSPTESGTQEPPVSQPDSGESILPGHLSSAVISATIRDPLNRQNIPAAVQYTLSTSDVVENSKRLSNSKRVCVFWNFSLMPNRTNCWSNVGCRVTHADSGVTSCLCNHTTNFAVLMNYLEPKWSPEEELILTKLTFIGSGASLCALVVTLMLFTVLDIPKSDRTSIHKNLFIALICAQVILLCSSSAIHNKVACTLVAALLHLFFMAAFSWMLVEGLLLWSKVVAVNLSEDQHMKYYYLIGWGLPVLIVTITLASASGKYSADGYCWLSVQNGVIWGFAGPVIFIIMVNIMILSRVVLISISTARRRSIMLAMGTSPVEQAYEQIRAAVKAVLVLLPILGLTWLCGVLVPFSIVMAYIFILLNSLQGLFIFLIYGVYNTEVRSTVNRIKERRKALNFSNCASSRPSSSVTSSHPVSFPTGSSPIQDEETTQTYIPETGKEEERSTGSSSL